MGSLIALVVSGTVFTCNFYTRACLNHSDGPQQINWVDSCEMCGSIGTDGTEGEEILEDEVQCSVIPVDSATVYHDVTFGAESLVKTSKVFISPEYGQFFLGNNIKTI